MRQFPWLVAIVALSALAHSVRPARADDPPPSEAEIARKYEDLQLQLKGIQQTLNSLNDMIARRVGAPPIVRPAVPPTTAAPNTIDPARPPQVLSASQRQAIRQNILESSPVVGTQGTTNTTGMPVRLTRPDGTRDTKLSITFPTGQWPGLAPADNGYYGAIGQRAIPMDGAPPPVAAVDRQIEASYLLGRTYDAALLTENGHSPIAAQQSALYGEAPRYFAVRGGAGTYSRLDSSYEFADRSSLADRAATDSVIVVSGSAKLAAVGSSASDKEFKQLSIGREHSLHKGFNVDALAVDQQLVLGDFVGHVAAEYFERPSGNDDHIELIKASGMLGYRRHKSDVRDIATLAFGSMSLPVGLYYNDNDWKYWAWSGRPFVYGRLFNGNLIGTGVMGLARIDPRNADGTQRVSEDLVFRFGAFNGQEAKMQGFIGGDPVGGFQLDSKERYSLTDLVVFGDVLVSRDLRPCRCDPLFVYAGAFGLHGPNGTGDDGETTMYGLRGRVLWLARRPSPDLNVLAQPSDGALVEGEWVKREYHVDAMGAVGPKNLEDWGAWASAIYTLKSPFEWNEAALSFGARLDIGSGHGDNFAKRRREDPMRDDRTRWSALVAWDPGCANVVLKHFTFSLEYQFDESDVFNHGVNTFVLGIQMR